jgi:hypothetical protein
MFRAVSHVLTASGIAKPGEVFDDDALSPESADALLNARAIELVAAPPPASEPAPAMASGPAPTGKKAKATEGADAKGG